MNEIPKVIRLLEMVADYYTLPAGDFDSKYYREVNLPRILDNRVIEPGYVTNIRTYLEQYYENLEGE